MTTRTRHGLQRRRNHPSVSGPMVGWWGILLVFSACCCDRSHAFTAYPKLQVRRLAPSTATTTTTSPLPPRAFQTYTLTPQRHSSTTAVYGVRSFLGRTFQKIRGRRRRQRRNDNNNNEATDQNIVNGDVHTLEEETEYALKETAVMSNVSEYSTVAYANAAPSAPLVGRKTTSQFFDIIDNENEVSAAAAAADTDTDTAAATSVATATLSHNSARKDTSSASLISSSPTTNTTTITTATTLLATTHLSVDPSLLCDKPLYEVFPLDDTRSLTPLEQEFRDMLQRFSNFSQRDIASLRDERVRALFEGVAASAHEPAVYRAFEVLFEDLYPLRIAARVIYKKLLHLMKESQEQRQRDVDTVVNVTGLDAVEVEASWLFFVSTASKINRGAYLTKDQLVQTGILNQVTELVHERALDALTQTLDKAKKGRITFVEFITSLHGCVQLECSVERQCDPLRVLQSMLHSIEALCEADSLDETDTKKKEFCRRYDEMLDSFVHWKELVPEGQGRRMDVVRGCFVGAENKEVVKALRICYVDYAGLRVAAEIIFKLVKALMAQRERAVQRKKADNHAQA